jgi:anti-sigma B factor antagonist
MSSSEFFDSAVIEGGILTIRLKGDLDSASTSEFDQAIRTHLSAGHSKIIIDCQRMGYLSSLGIGSLVALQTRLRRKGGLVKLAAIQGPVMEVMKAVRLDKMFDIYGDLEFARKSFEDNDTNA